MHNVIFYFQFATYNKLSFCVLIIIFPKNFKCRSFQEKILNDDLITYSIHFSYINCSSAHTPFWARKSSLSIPSVQSDNNLKVFL